MHIEYLARDESANVICVITEHDLSDCRVFVGPEALLREVRVTDIHRYRVGGAVFINTLEGEFYVPRAGRVRKAPRRGLYQGRPVALLDRSTRSAELRGGALILH